MTRIKSDDKKRQMVYIYNNFIGGCVSVELAHPEIDRQYHHCNLSLEEFEHFVSDCQELLTSIKGQK